MMFLLIGLTITIWLALIIDGVVLNKKEMKNNPRTFYEYKMTNLQSYLKHCDQVLKEQIIYYNELASTTKKNQVKIKCKEKIKKSQAKHSKQIKKTNIKISLLNKQYKHKHKLNLN
jgi:hypothetical protein